MAKLGVNVDHIATLRQARRALESDPVQAAMLCELAGCDSIVVHLREDRRHIHEKDLQGLRDTVKIRLNLEMSVAPEIVEIARTIRPQQATLVPERREELTTEGGLDVRKGRERIRQVVESLQERRIEASLFIDPDVAQLEAAKDTGARIVELHTGRYAESRSEAEFRSRLQELEAAIRTAHALGFVVNAGHGLTYGNVKAVSRLAGIEELNIGHSIVARAVFVGMERAVREMLALVRSSS